MVDHAALADAELHTPKGADSAADHDMLYALGTGATSMSQFLEFCGTGYTSTGIYDYSTDGAITGGSYLQFSGLENYSYLVLDITNFILTSSNSLSLQLGTSGAWQTGSNYQMDYFFKSNAADGNFSSASTIYANLIYTPGSGTQLARLEFFNFNSSAPTVTTVNRMGYVSGSNYANIDGIGVHNVSSAMSRIRLSVPSTNTSGIAVLRGIKG